MRAEGWDDACVCGMKFGDGSCCLLAKSEAFLFHDGFSLTFAAFGGF